MTKEYDMLAFKGAKYEIPTSYKMEHDIAKFYARD